MIVKIHGGNTKMAFTKKIKALRRQYLLLKRKRKLTAQEELRLRKLDDYLLEHNGFTIRELTASARRYR